MSPTGGHRPVLHNVFAIEDKQLVLPDAVALDTNDGRSRPRAARLMNNALARYDELLESLPHISIPLDQVADSAVQIMTKYGLASYDAIHAATTIAADADAMVTTDTGFALMPASLLTVYTDQSRLAFCRKNRPRR